jgi:hypothetical protein
LYDLGGELRFDCSDRGIDNLIPQTGPLFFQGCQ